MKRFLSAVLLLCILCSVLVSCSGSKEIIGEPCTEKEWAEMVAGVFNNYSGETESGSGVLFYQIDGEQWREKLVFGDTIVRENGCFLINGDLYYLAYDHDSGKWVETEPIEKKVFPGYGLPYDRNNFSYDSKTGTYYYKIPKAVELFEQNGIDSDPHIYIKFLEGKCVYFTTPYKVSEDDGHLTSLTCRMYDYGTTDVELPPMEDIIFAKDAQK